MFGSRSAGLLLVCAALLRLGLTPGQARAAQSQSLAGHRPAAAVGVQAVGRLPGQSRLRLGIGLPLRNQAELADLLERLYDPASSSYRQWLSVGQFTERFGPAEADCRAVMAFLEAHGLRITATLPSRMIINAEGAVADIERAFQVGLRLYQHPSEGRLFYAPDSEPTLELATPVLHISGLDNFMVPRPAGLRTPRPEGPGGAVPCSGSGPSGSYWGKDFRAAYAPNVALTGTGQFVALLEMDGYYSSDISTYATRAGLGKAPPLVNVLLDDFSGAPGDGNGEVALDIEMAMSMAPGLSGIIVYEGNATQGTAVDNILGRMAGDNLAKQLSGSWMFAVDATTSQIFQQFAAQGQSYFNASGDGGAYVGPVSSPSDNPYITVVGGTTLSTTGPMGSWLSETAWNWFTSGLGTAASAGGVSTLWPIQSWQKGLDMTLNRGSTSKRNLPDVAMVADNVTVISDNGKQVAVGGTSIATPLWAGFIALVNQQAAATQQPSVGFINPAIYALGKASSYTSCFHDIKTGNNTNLDSPDLYYAVPGYDLVTGWGSPSGKNLINHLAPLPQGPLIALAGSSLVSESFVPANGAIDPGETVLVNVSLQSIGAAATTNLVATLMADTNVLAPSDPQVYGALAGGGTTATRAFTFTANGPCGGSISPVIQLQDGPADLGAVVLSFRLGAPLNALHENFDGVAAPALPQGWTTAVSGAASNWVTSNALRDTAPNAASVHSAVLPGISELLSPVIPIATASAQLSFRNFYNMESATDTILAYDGGVLEISLGGGPFADILDAEGSFVAGGYTRTIDSTDDNPLGGRRVWSGVSGTFITTTVNLPAAAAGQSIQLKWRLGMDTGNYLGQSTWCIDTVTVQDGYACSGPASPANLALAQTSFPNPATVGQPLQYLLSITNAGSVPALDASLTDTLPDGVTFVSASPGCTVQGGAVVCGLGLLPSGSNASLTISVLPTAAGSLTNTVVLSSGPSDTNLVSQTNLLVVSALGPPTLSLAPLALGSASVPILFNSVTGLTYTLEYKDSLLDAQWTPLLPAVPGTGGLLLLQDTNAPLQPSRFYRVSCQ